jgi:hypothetical protein
MFYEDSIIYEVINIKTRINLNKVKFNLILLFFFLLTIYPFLIQLIKKNKLVYIPISYLSIWQGAMILFFLVFFKVYELKFRKIDTILLLYFLTFLYTATISIGHGDFKLLLHGFDVTYIPILMYFIARSMKFKVAFLLNFIDKFLSLIFLVTLIGFFLYIIRPNYYLELQSLARFGEINQTNINLNKYYIRMSSILFSVNVFGSLMVISTNLSILMFLYKKKWIYSLYIISFIIGTILSFSRGSWVFLTISLFFYFLLFFLNKNKKNIITKRVFAYILIFILLMSVVYLIIHNFNLNIVKALINRVKSLFMFNSTNTSAYDGRLSQWQYSLQTFLEAPYGQGLGRAGHALAYYGKNSNNNPGSADGWYFKLLLEGGIITFFSFSFYLIYQIIYYFINFNKSKNKFIQLLICSTTFSIIGFSFQGIGSNVWDFYLVSSFLWFMIGITNNLIINKNIVFNRN